MQSCFDDKKETVLLGSLRFISTIVDKFISTIVRVYGDRYVTAKHISHLYTLKNNFTHFRSLFQVDKP